MMQTRDEFSANEEFKDKEQIIFCTDFQIQSVKKCLYLLSILLENTVLETLIQSHLPQVP